MLGERREGEGANICLSASMNFYCRIFFKKSAIKVVAFNRAEPKLCHRQATFLSLFGFLQIPFRKPKALSLSVSCM